MCLPPDGFVDGLPSCMAGEYSVVTAIFELWLVLMKFSPELPTLLSFYHDFVGHLSVEELNELAERQGVSFHTLLTSNVDL